MSDDKICCKAITKIVKSHEAMDGYKIMSHTAEVTNDQENMKEPP